MTIRSDFALLALRIVCLAILLGLSGCTVVPPQGDQQASSTTSAPRPSGADASASADGGLVAGRAAASAQARQHVQAKTTAPVDSRLPTIEISMPAQFPQTIDLTAEAADLFERMRNGYSMPNISNDLVLYHQQWYLNRTMPPPAKAGRGRGGKKN